MYLVSWSSNGGVIQTEDGRTITISEGAPVSVSPADIVLPEAPVAPEETPAPAEAPSEAPPADEPPADAPVA